jgi:thioredoxin 1
MSCLCIGGVCIPYAGLIPLLLLALQWVAAQLVKVGLLPDFLAKRLGLNDDCSSGATSSCCGENKETATTTQQRRRRRTARESSTASTANTTDVDDNNDEDEKKDDDEISSNNLAGGGGEIEHIDTLTRWSDVFTKSKHQSKNNNSASLLLFVKFTAEWCKPCKVIQPTYIEMATQYPKEKFVSVDVDGDDCDVLSSKLRVAMMPTFICFRNGVEIGRVSGGNNPENLKSWVEKMMTA